MIWKTHDYDRIPGTYVFDGRRAVRGYALNKMCMSFNSAENRHAFGQGEAAYCRRYGLTEAQTEAVLRRDWLRLLELGANVYYLGKLATAAGGYGVQDLGAQMTGMSPEEFRARLQAAAGA